MQPDLRFIISKTTERHRWYVPSRLVSRTSFQSSSFISSSGWSRTMPAEVTAMSTAPSRSSVAATSSRTESATETSAWWL